MLAWRSFGKLIWDTHTHTHTHTHSVNSHFTGSQWKLGPAPNLEPIIKRMVVQKEDGDPMCWFQRCPGTWATEKIASCECLGSAKNWCCNLVGYACGREDATQEAWGFKMAQEQREELLSKVERRWTLSGPALARIPRLILLDKDPWIFESGLCQSESP